MNPQLRVCQLNLGGALRVLSLVAGVLVAVAILLSNRGCEVKNSASNSFVNLVTMQVTPRAKKVGFISPENVVGSNQRLVFALKLSIEVYKFICRNPETLLPDAGAQSTAGSLVNICGLPRFLFAYVAQVYSSQTLLDKVCAALGRYWGH